MGEKTAFTMFNAVWLVDSWDEKGGTIKEQLAYCKSFACGEAAYNAAIESLPYDRITFRQGARVMRERPASKWKPDVKKAGTAPKDSTG